ncbi:hypothetical protein MKY34_19650 [Sporosarcina sp. FSL K6-1522]|uniref:hypothetical protein n=1 Tax=Sporosarcina sp. FSL K6-1522 TaxID=2921554 RepID=UPI00315AB738
MITNDTVMEYIEKMPGSDLFLELDQDEQVKHIFAAHELLKDNFRESSITDRAVAMQTLYMLEGEDEEYAKLKRHGVKSYAVKGVSVTFDGSNISPDVSKLLKPKSGSGLVGRLI